MGWAPLASEREIGRRGTEGGVVVHDEEHPGGARITLERDCTIAPWTITCGMYGWFFHTRFIGVECVAVNEYNAMREGLVDLLALLPDTDDPKLEEKMAAVGRAVEQFVARFP